MSRYDRTNDAEIAAFAHLATEDIRGEVERLNALEQAGFEYFLSTPSTKVQENSTNLFRFRRELNRREAVTVEDVAAFVSADLLARYGVAAE